MTCISAANILLKAETFNSIMKLKKLWLNTFRLIACLIFFFFPYPEHSLTHISGKRLFTDNIYYINSVFFHI